jgi:hypothetical protein
MVFEIDGISVAYVAVFIANLSILMHVFSHEILNAEAGLGGQQIAAKMDLQTRVFHIVLNLLKLQIVAVIHTDLFLQRSKKILVLIHPWPP